MLRLLRGEDLELVSRELGVTAAELSAWRDAFLAAGEASLKTRPADARDAEIGRLKAKVGELTMANELLGAKIEHLEARPPFGPPEVEAMSRQVSPSTDRAYGVQRVARGLGRLAGDGLSPPPPGSGGERAGGPGRSARCRTRRWSRRSGSS